jgi:hypothetical protein
MVILTILVLLQFFSMTFQKGCVLKSTHQFRKAKKFRAGSSCNAFTRYFTLKEKQDIVNYHNIYRNQVAMGTTPQGTAIPLANNMLKVYWSDEIASKAQAWANNCQFVHSSNEYRNISKFSLGENLFEAMGAKTYAAIDWKKAVDVWFNEIKDFNGNLKFGSNSSSGTVGHFTQIAWAKTYQIGCGLAQYFDAPSNWYITLYVCEYGPVGNVSNQQIYAGSSTQGCTCPSGTSCKHSVYKGLCCANDRCGHLTFSGTILGTSPRLHVFEKGGAKCYDFEYE